MAVNQACSVMHKLHGVEVGSGVSVEGGCLGLDFTCLLDLSFPLVFSCHAMIMDIINSGLETPIDQGCEISDLKRKSTFSCFSEIYHFRFFERNKF